LVACSFLAFHPSPDKTESPPSFRAALLKLIHNIKTSFSFRDFWCLAFWKFLTPSTYQSLTSTWGVAYVKALGYPQDRAVYYIAVTSIAWTVGAPFLAVATNWVRTRKWCLVGCTAVATGAAIGFTLIDADPGVPALLAMLFVFALTSGASLTIAAITFKEMLSKELVGTLMGCGNLVMIGASIEQDITAAVVAKYERAGGDVPLIAYRYGLWLLSAVSCGISIVLLLIIKDTYQKAVTDEQKERNAAPQSLDVPMISAGDAE
jgi:MFS family permease